MPNLRRTAVQILVGLCCAIVLPACGGSQSQTSVYPGLDEESRMSVLNAQGRQKAMGDQIESIKQKDNALDLCFEMCNRGKESCVLSDEMCQYSRKFPNEIALVATCSYSRELCRRHKQRVPRQCNCIWEAGS